MGSDGVVYENEAVRLLDTRELPWATPAEGEPFHGTGVKVKVLARDDDGAPLVQLLWIPAGTPSFSPGGLRERHYHRTVREFVCTLEGELPFREYPELDGEGVPVVSKQGYFLDRRPGPASGHGMDGERVSEVGCVMLEVRTGAGSQMAEHGSERETVVLADADLPR